MKKSISFVGRVVIPKETSEGRELINQKVRKIRDSKLYYARKAGARSSGRDLQLRRGINLGWLSEETRFLQAHSIPVVVTY